MTVSRVDDVGLWRFFSDSPQTEKDSVERASERLDGKGLLRRRGGGREKEGEGRKGKLTRLRGSASSRRSSGGEKFCSECVATVRKEEGLSESELI